MRLEPGSRIGAYRVEGLLGAGGMGEVYRARDGRLGRDVALKVLPPAFAADSSRLARFEREAQVLASLNHPNIAAIYGIEEAVLDGGVRAPALVLELVEGETLAAALARSPLPVARALAVARQIADALDAAHDKGIVHRDLKPSNISLTPDGGVKVLDFGIAKSLANATGDSGAAPTTLAAPDATDEGTILGTAAYMSPEQARGQAVDKRTDIWAFGCVLYEMLAGRAAFARQTMTDTLSAVIEKDPDWTALPADTPEGARYVLRRCLEKSPRERLRDIGDARHELERGREPLPGPRPAVRWAWLGAALATTALVGGVAYWLGARAFDVDRPATRAGVVRFEIHPPAGTGFLRAPTHSFLALSPDGSHVAFSLRERDRVRIWLRPLAGIESRPIAGTENGMGPFWSPDGRSLAFFAGGQLKRVDIRGGAAVPVCDISDVLRSHGVWGSAGTILFGSTEGRAIYAVPAAGGTPHVILKPDAARDEARASLPWFLPDGLRFFYLARLRDGTGRLMLTEAGGAPRVILTAVSSVQWIDPDLLLYTRDGVLLAQRFDVEREQVVGEALPVAEPVDYHYTIGRALFSASRNGTIVYHAHSDAARLVWVNRKGEEQGAVGEPGGYQNLRISPDGQRVLFDRMASGSGAWDLWTRDFARGVETRLTSDRGSEVTPAWMPGGRGIVFGADRGGPPRLFRKDLVTGGEEELSPVLGRQQMVGGITPDGRTLVFLERNASGQLDVFTLQLDGNRERAPLITSAFNKADVRVSPDGTALAYASDETGRWEVYVRPLTANATPITVSGTGGSLARWSPDGRALFYVTRDRQLVSVPVQTKPALDVGQATTLFTLPSAWSDFDVASDGRFLAVVPLTRPAELPLTVIANWTPEVR